MHTTNQKAKWRGGVKSLFLGRRMSLNKYSINVAQLKLESKIGKTQQQKKQVLKTKKTWAARAGIHEQEITGRENSNIIPRPDKLWVVTGA